MYSPSGVKRQCRVIRGRLGMEEMEVRRGCLSCVLLSGCPVFVSQKPAEKYD